MAPLWNALRGHARAFLSGHDHNLQRLRPAGGITQYIAGAGGASQYAVDGATRSSPGASTASSARCGSCSSRAWPRSSSATRAGGCSTAAAGAAQPRTRWAARPRARGRREVVLEVRRGLHAIEPGRDVRRARADPPPTPPAVDVRVEGDVGDRVVVAGHERRATRREAALERDERVAARGRADSGRPRAPARGVPTATGSAPRRAPARSGSARRTSTGARACAGAGGGQERGALAKVEQDRARLRELLPRVELEHRHAPVRVAREVLVGARLAREEVDGHELERQPELPQQDARLQAVSGGRMVVEDHGSERYRAPPTWITFSLKELARSRRKRGP